MLVGIKSKPVKILVRLKFGHQAQNLATFRRFFSPIRYFLYVEVMSVRLCIYTYQQN